MCYKIATKPRDSRFTAAIMGHTGARVKEKKNQGEGRRKKKTGRYSAVAHPTVVSTVVLHHPQPHPPTTAREMTKCIGRRECAGQGWGAGCHRDMHQPLINEVSRPLFKITGVTASSSVRHLATLHRANFFSFASDTPTSPLPPSSPCFEGPSGR